MSLLAWPEGASGPWMWGLRVGLLVLLVGMGCWLPVSRYASRWVFGLLAFAVTGVLGALLAQERVHAVRYDWPSEPAVYRATLLESPQEKAKTFRCRLRVEAWYGSARSLTSSVGEVSSSGSGPLSVDSLLLVGEGIPVQREVWAYVMKDSLSEQWNAGDGLFFYAKVEPPRSSALPDAFDYATYLFRKGVSGTAVVYADRWLRLDESRPLTWKQQALACRERVLATYRRWGFKGEEGAVLSALTVGYKADLSEEVQAVYRQAGVSHILALSGMHVAILWGLLAFLLRPLDAFRSGRWVKCACVIGLLWAFAFLVGLSASVVRAVVMCMLLMMAQAASSEFSSMNSLSVAAAGMLCHDPFYLFDVGFQLSFLAVFSILLIYPLVFRCWTVRQPVLRYVWGIVSVSLSAQLGTAPLILYYFSHFPVYFLLANVWVAPLVCLVVYGAVLLWATAPFGGIHVWVVAGMQLLLQAMNAGLRQVSVWPMAETGSLTLSLSLLAALYGLLAVSWWGIVRRTRLWGILWLLAVHGVCAALAFQLYFTPAPRGVYLSDGRVVAYPKEALWQCDSLYRYSGVTIGLVASDRWAGLRSTAPLPLDYLYLCRGYKGTIASLQRLFRIRKVVLDGSLSSYWRARYEEECHRLGLEFIVLEAKGSYRILP